MRNRFVRIRPPLITPLAPGDEETVQTVFDGLTAKQRWQWFHVAMPQLPLAIRRHLADVDGRDRHALAAVLGGRPVGIGRYTLVGPARAEVAVAVAAAHTGRGLGTALVDALARHAVLAGIEDFVFEVTGTNAVALHMARSRGADLVTASGVAHGSLSLGPLPLATRTA